jgi:hypothetical protein
MRQHLPSKQEMIEIVALGCMLLALQTLIGSWGWTIVFALGFVWNWAVLNGWTLTQAKTKKYRFSMLRLIVDFHRLWMAPFKRFPRFQQVFTLVPASLFVALMGYVSGAELPWVAAILGSFGFWALRSQLSRFF